MIIENLSTLKINKMSQEQYDREDVAGNINPNEIYLTPVEDLDIQQQIEIALEEAKESGDFDGKDGTTWYCGTRITDNNAPLAWISGAKAGDFYLNTSTNDYYLASVAGVWVKQGKLGMTEEETKAYIRSYIDELILNGEW